MEKYYIGLVDSAMERAGDICKKLHLTDIKMERVVGSGDAKDVICRAVKKFEVDTSVMGTHSYGFFKRSGDSTTRIWMIDEGRCKFDSRIDPPNVLVLPHPRGINNEKSKDVTTLDWFIQ
ncbi:uncharacterized protein LOC131646357 [Vicia villosa]|uniref:uncharacterized protein LOC131646357 n=1 Tax=Vicia villosa TaxID=3911 RepID=UPI00273C284C|nr:uncharacterized protein LOC131646357 [Vicia villosa]XP_058772400.1 uncharacterized protein LOC131646357 [Vicia villosa]